MTKILRALVCFTIITSSCKQVNHDPKTDHENLAQNGNAQWVSLMIEGYQKFNKDRSVEASDTIFEATELMVQKNLENYLVIAMVYAQNNEKEKAFKAIERAIEEGFRDSKLLSSIPEYSSLQNDPRWNKLILETNNRRSTYEKSIQNVQLLEMLRTLWIQDQEVLAQYEENIKKLGNTVTFKDDRSLFKPIENRWRINKNKLDSIITIYGWPGNKLVGKEGAKVSWGIAQHHPDIFFKKKCLLLIKEAMQKGDVDPNHYAQLKDRIARETWQKQTYGTSIDRNKPFPIKNPSYINKKRLEIGLYEPMEVHSIYHGIQYSSPSQEEIQSIYENAQKNYNKFEEFLKLKMIDSANNNIVQAISAHGDISNKQLYNASTLLAKTNNKRSHRICIRILKVLIWRRWDKRFKILEKDEFIFLHNTPEWRKIQNIVELST